MVSPPISFDPAFAASTLSFELLAGKVARRSKLTFTDRGGGQQGESDNGREIQTPAVIMFSSRGAVPHLTPDNLSRLPAEMVHVSLEHLLEKREAFFVEAPYSLARFLALHGSSITPSQLLSMTLREPSGAKPGDVPNSNNSVSAKTWQGVIQVSPADYLSWSLPRPPDILVSIGDEPPVAELSRKRVVKVLSRSFSWLSDVAKGAKHRTNVFAALVGGNSLNTRKEFAMKLLGSRPGSPCLDDSLSGYSLAIPTLLNDSDPSVIDLFRASLDPLPALKPRLALGVVGPHDILQLVRNVGIDLFVDEWSSICASFGVALDFDFPPSSSPPPGDEKKKSIGINLFDPTHIRSFEPLSQSRLAIPTRPNHHPIPSDDRQLEVFGNTQPTKSYVHHLLKSHEMTANVALALHNSTVMFNFFGAIRRSIEDGSFDHSVGLFSQTYSEPEGGVLNGGEYVCLKEAKEDWAKVNLVRGKGSLREKRLEDAAAEQDATALAARESAAALASDTARTGTEKIEVLRQ
ncbi:tRNA-guanine transglycosylase [Meredithblackwellia eburnea MCA 4105]